MCCRQRELESDSADPQRSQEIDSKTPTPEKGSATRGNLGTLLEYGCLEKHSDKGPIAHCFNPYALISRGSEVDSDLHPAPKSLDPTNT